MEYTRYETRLLNRIARCIIDGKIEQAKNLYKIAQKIENQFNTVELEVYKAHGIRLYGDKRPLFISETACYYEGKILAKQGL